MYFFPQVREANEEENLEFDPELSDTIYDRFTSIVYNGVWGDLSYLTAHWFAALPDRSRALVKLSANSAGSFRLELDDGSSIESKLDTEAFFKSFYCDEQVTVMFINIY